MSPLGARWGKSQDKVLDNYHGDDLVLMMLPIMMVDSVMSVMPIAMTIIAVLVVLMAL